MKLLNKSSVMMPVKTPRPGLSHREQAGLNASRRAFTMIEIAISLAIIGFALAAIVGVLPLGMNVQKQNREETVINQDSGVWMDAIRNGARGFDDLTNYVISITNYISTYSAKGVLLTKTPTVYWYTKTASSTTPQYPINSGLRIIGLLSTPTYIPNYDPSGNYLGYYSNRVSAYVRAMSGPASERFPQRNTDVQDLAFGYRITPEVVNYWTNYFDPSWQVYPGFAAGDTNAMIAWTNSMIALATLQTNIHDVRLSFRWPLLAKNAPGPSQQAFRTVVGGQLTQTNEPNAPVGYASGGNLYFFQPRTFVKAQ